MLFSIFFILLSACLSVNASNWAGKYASELLEPVDYPYKIHTGKLKGIIKYTDGPKDIDVGTLVMYELQSAFFFKGGQWLLVNSDRDDGKTFQVSNEFAEEIFPHSEWQDTETLENTSDEMSMHLHVSKEMVEEFYAAAVESAHSNDLFEEVCDSPESKWEFPALDKSGKNGIEFD
ncbi:hypothetical protein HYPBUDRAFT_139553 [Hyphopichia burtonii NRRL Y-1933]|uniref:Uncharacterized protein n=1 Tax=Hyphopichia burtonii NRRL Y-1933 TaxID=984485 RepID=A0A1E4RIN3_9ASCO|nr:hypothetical protein HYPBUDRAFT_139553 [Hyphopichia burtonii NRRL Y-1933]ODV67090.1 hypothetical protein HYPBUDRAFT_139553 [Hyphopichia burtonii NRRL Y-1933]